MNKKSKDELAEHCTLGQIWGSEDIKVVYDQKFIKKNMVFESKPSLNG